MTRTNIGCLQMDPEVEFCALSSCTCPLFHNRLVEYCGWAAEGLMSDPHNVFSFRCLVCSRRHIFSCIVCVQLCSQGRCCRVRCAHLSLGGRHPLLSNVLETLGTSYAQHSQLLCCMFTFVACSSQGNS